MKKKVLIILIIVFVLIALVGIGLKFKDNNVINFGDKEVNALKQEEYTIDLTEEEDHYILTVQTNIINSPFSFSYDSKNFVLDTSSNIFDNIIAVKDNDNKKYTLDLESNMLYKFYFIKKNNTKMELNKNLHF